MVQIIQASVIKQNQALRLKARKECWDRDGKERVTGGVLEGRRCGWGRPCAPTAGEVGKVGEAARSLEEVLPGVSNKLLGAAPCCFPHPPPSPACCSTLALIL